jgi:hypothetical protein
VVCSALGQDDPIIRITVAAGLGKPIVRGAIRGEACSRETCPPLRRVDGDKWRIVRHWRTGL